MTEAPATPDPAERARLSSAAARHLADRHGWSAAQYRLEFQQVRPGDTIAIVRAVFLEDERHPVPGGGQSRELHIDRASGAVVRELRFQ